MHTHLDARRVCLRVLALVVDALGREGMCKGSQVLVWGPDVSQECSTMPSP